MGMEKRHRSNLEAWSKILDFPIGSRVRLLIELYPIAKKGEKGRIVRKEVTELFGKLYCIEFDNGCYVCVKGEHIELVEE